MQKVEFYKCIDSLKKYRRAEFSDASNVKIKDIYTDLLPENYVLNKCLAENTTLLVGRKGTGKSTIFLMLEEIIKKDKEYFPIYIDVKTVYEKSNYKAEKSYLKNVFVSPDTLDKYVLERNFVKAFLQATLHTLEELYTDKARDKFELTKSKERSAKDGIKDTLKKLEEGYLQNIEIPIIKEVIEGNELVEENKSIEESKIALPSIKMDPTGITINNDTNVSNHNCEDYTKKRSQSFTRIFLQVFSIKEIILDIKRILEPLNVKKVYIMLDDLSEIEDDNALITFTDTIIAPLNNWSEDFIKFKIASYPGRFHYGKIDPSKIDEINLDFYMLYSEFDRNKMESIALDFTNRLMKNRLAVFNCDSFETYFEVNDKVTYNMYIDLLFKVSMNVPRIIGYILNYCYEAKILYGNKIILSDIENAAQKYYELKVCTFFNKNVYSLKVIDEKVEIIEMEELLNKILNEFQSIKNKIKNDNLSSVLYEKKDPYLSHFHVSPKSEFLLKSLELNHFISKYMEQKNKDGEIVSVYAINYGLARKNYLRWGKNPLSKYRKYFIQRPFNFNRLIVEFFQEKIEYRCSNDSCARTFSSEEWSVFNKYGAICPICKSQIKKYKKKNESYEILKDINLVPSIKKEYLEVIIELNSKPDKSAYAKDLAEELDYSKYQIAKWCSQLKSEYEYITISKNSKGINHYKLKDDIAEIYNI